MTWPNKPTIWWQWLLLVSPGILSVLMTAFGKLMLSRKDEIGPSIISLPIVLVLCLGLSFYFARGTDGVGRTIGRTVLFSVILLIVNFSITFAGCAVIKPRLFLG